MKNGIRCCISCILPCGALDVIRIVHANGRVEVISAPIKAQEIMKLHPKHVLKKPLPPSEQGAHHKVTVVPPEAELKRGKIYFLIPLQPGEKTRPRSVAKRKVKEVSGSCNNCYLSEILTESVSTKRDRRRGRAGVWRPYLDSISETPLQP